MQLHACLSCGQLWRLDIPPVLRPRASKVSSEIMWTQLSESKAVEHRSTVELTASELVRKSWSFLRSHFLSLTTAAAAPLSLSFLFGAISLAARPVDISPTLVLWLHSLLEVLPWTLFGVAWHRLILSGEPAAVSAEWSPSHTRFAAFLLIWRLPSLLVSQPDIESEYFWLGAFTIIAGGIAVAYLYARYSLFLPAAAIAQPISPTDAWTSSRGYGGTLFWSGVLAGLFSFILCIPLFVATIVLGQYSFAMAEMATIPLNCATQLIFEALAVGALSFAYRAIRLHEPATRLQG